MVISENLILLLLYLTGLCLIFGGADLAVLAFAKWQHRQFTRKCKLTVLPKSAPKGVYQPVGIRSPI